MPVASPPRVGAEPRTADLGTGYDLVLVPNFLHHFNPAECTRFLARVHAALRPGGRVVVVEFVPNEDRVTPEAAAGFSLVILGTTPEGDAYTFAQYQAMLTAAGFRDATLHPLPPTAESAVIATKWCLARGRARPATTPPAERSTRRIAA